MQILSKILKLFAPCLLALVALCTTIPCTWAEEIEGTIKYWVDGDTCVFEPAAGGEDIRVRLWGVDAPEKDQPMGQDAWRYMKYNPEFGDRKRVVLDKIATDKYRRTIGQLRGAKAIEYCTADLLRSGYFWLYEPAVRGRPEEVMLKNAFETTKTAKRGIFKYDSSVAPWDWRKMKQDAKQKAREAFELERRSKG